MTGFLVGLYIGGYICELATYLPGQSFKRVALDSLCWPYNTVKYLWVTYRSQ